MQTTPRFFIAASVLVCWTVGGDASADSIRLTNGDTIVGAVVSLDDEQLVVESENFGEMKIPRDKVAIIGLGDAPLAQAPASAVPSAPSAPAASGEIPSLQNPQVRQQIDHLLQQALGGGIGGSGDMRQQMESTRRGLQDLQKDLGPGSSADALDGYIKLFEMFGGGGAGVQRQPPARPNGQPAQPNDPPSQPNDGN